MLCWAANLQGCLSSCVEHACQLIRLISALLGLVSGQGLAAVVGGAVVLFARYGGEGLRSRLEDVAAPAFGFVGSCYDWAREKLSGGPACHACSCLQVRLKLSVMI